MWFRKVLCYSICLLQLRGKSRCMASIFGPWESQSFLGCRSLIFKWPSRLFPCHLLSTEMITHLSMTLHRVKCSCKTSRKPSSVKVFVSSFYHKVGDFLSPYSALRRRRTLFGFPKVRWEFHKDSLIKSQFTKAFMASVCWFRGRVLFWSPTC